MTHEHDDDLRPSLEPQHEGESVDRPMPEEELDHEGEEREPEGAIVRE